MADTTIFLGGSDGRREELFLPLGQPPRARHRRHRHRQDGDLQIMAEGFSKAGVSRSSPPTSRAISPAFRWKASPKDFLIERAKKIGFDDYGFEAFPTIFWDLFGEQGHPIRTTVSEMGPLLLSRLMGLTEAQEGALNIAFKIADEEGLAILDLKDLRALLTDLAERGKEIRTEYGNVNAPPSAPSSAASW